MNPVPSSSAIQQIEIFSKWIGFGSPSSRASKLTITNRRTHFDRQWALHPTSDTLTDQVISQLTGALARPPIPSLAPNNFGFPAAAIESHYSCCWTNDYPMLLVRIVCDSGRLITIRSENQHAFMLPLRITNFITNVTYETFDPELSRAIAELLPEKFPERERLIGRSAMLELDLERFQREDLRNAAEVTPVSSQTETTDLEEISALNMPNAAALTDDITGSHSTLDEDFAQLTEILFERNVEDSGAISENLLRRISLDQMRDLIREGANCSIADDVGQTALMHAAFPPFNRDRFRLLVEAGADVNARRSDGLTGLHIACAGGAVEPVDEWILAGADISARTKEGATPLMLGAEWPAIVRTLLKSGAEIDAVDHDGHCAIVYAILGQHWIGGDNEIEALSAMIDAGANVNIRDCEGISPLGHAKKHLAETLLEDEVTLAMKPAEDLNIDARSQGRQFAEAVITILIAAGGIE